MTQAEQDRDLADAQAYLSATTLTVDRCRHESVDATSLWFFHDGKQVGAASRTATGWQVSGMAGGMPTSQHSERTLLDAIGHLMRVTK